MSLRKRAFLLSIGAAGVVAALSGAMLEGCVAIGFAVEAYVLCSGYLLPGGDDGGEDGTGADEPTPPPTGPSATAEPAERELTYA